MGYKMKKLKRFRRKAMKWGASIQNELTTYIYKCVIYSDEMIADITFKLLMEWNISYLRVSRCGEEKRRKNTSDETITFGFTKCPYNVHMEWKPLNTEIIGTVNDKCNA